MKKSDLFREYACTIDMCEGTGVDPSRCVKVDGKEWGLIASRDLRFDSPPEYYDFALAIVEGKPVFKGDEIFFKNGRTTFAWGGDDNVADYAREDLLTWTKPRTFTLNGEVLPCPGGPLMEGPVYELRIANRSWFFENFEDRSAVEDAINKILSDAENS